MVEYVLAIALVGIGLAVIVLTFRDSIGGVFDTTVATLEDRPNGCKNPMPAAKNPNC